MAATGSGASTVSTTAAPRRPGAGRRRARVARRPRSTRRWGVRAAGSTPPPGAARSAVDSSGPDASAARVGRRRARARGPRSRPSTRTRPTSGSRWPESRWRRVRVPDPSGPHQRQELAPFGGERHTLHERAPAAPHADRRRLRVPAPAAPFAGDLGSPYLTEPGGYCQPPMSPADARPPPARPPHLPRRRRAGGGRARRRLWRRQRRHDRGDHRDGRADHRRAGQRTSDAATQHRARRGTVRGVGTERPRRASRSPSTPTATSASSTSSSTCSPSSTCTMTSFIVGNWLDANPDMAEAHRRRRPRVRQPHLHAPDVRRALAATRCSTRSSAVATCSSA